MPKVVLKKIGKNLIGNNKEDAKCPLACDILWEKRKRTMENKEKQVNASLTYTGIDKHEGAQIGGWDTVVSKEEAEMLLDRNFKGKKK